MISIPYVEPLWIPGFEQYTPVSMVTVTTFALVLYDVVE